MASMVAAQAVAVAGLGSSMLRTSDVKGLRGSLKVARSSGRQVVSPIRAAKLPQGVGVPKDEPKLPVSFWGFTENAEVWNSRASMIGLFGIIILEAVSS
ncbi:hypothetical protein M758_8G151300 [Ceratodon purpureus]|nr:hypothetical protein M758_8G151300 [Ceratodon purpureus]